MTVEGEKMKIIYCGIDVYLPVFEYLADSKEHEIIALYTYHEESEYIRDEKIIAAAKRRGIPSTLERLSAARLEELFRNGGCDLLLSAEYDRKLPVLDLDRYRGINIHNSLLPEGRGYFPVEMRLYKGYPYGGVTIHKLAEAFDQGDILLQERFSIAPEDCSLDVYRKSEQIALKLMKCLMGDFSKYWMTAQPQDETKASWWPIPSREALTITPDMCIEQIRRVFRSFHYLSRLEINGQRYAVRWMECMDHAGNVYIGPPEDDQFASFQEIAFKARDGMVRVKCEMEAEACGHETKR